MLKRYLPVLQNLQQSLFTARTWANTSILMTRLLPDSCLMRLVTPTVSAFKAYPIKCRERQKCRVLWRLWPLIGSRSGWTQRLLLSTMITYNSKNSWPAKTAGKYHSGEWRRAADMLTKAESILLPKWYAGRLIRMKALMPYIRITQRQAVEERSAYRG